MNWGLSFDEISEVYLDLVRYRHDEYVEPTKWRADLIINGSNPSEKAVKMILSYVLGETELKE
jgi:uridine kinase